jgi:hypothetical protein
VEHGPGRDRGGRPGAAGDLLARPVPAQVRALAYHLSVFLLVLVDSGVLRSWPRPSRSTCACCRCWPGRCAWGLSNFWIQAWLAPPSATADGRALRLCAVALPAGGWPRWRCRTTCSCRRRALVAAGRRPDLLAHLPRLAMGDRWRSPWPPAALLTLPALAGLYALAMQPGPGPRAAGRAGPGRGPSNALTGHVLWRRARAPGARARPARRADRPGHPGPQQHGAGAAPAGGQKRRRRTGREGALLAVTVFDAGTHRHRRRQRGRERGVDDPGRPHPAPVGFVNPVGRYWDRCFVALVETVPRALAAHPGPAPAAALRQPIEVTGRDGEPVQVRVDFGVGVVPWPPPAEAEDVLTRPSAWPRRRGRCARGRPCRPATGSACRWKRPASDRHARAARRARPARAS